MQVNAKMYADTLHLEIAGELDENSANLARDALDTQMETNNCKQIIIDLSKLDFMDSTGIGVLMGRYRKMKAKNVPIFIANPSAQADKIFKMTALYDVMPLVKGGDDEL